MGVKQCLKKVCYFVGVEHFTTSYIFCSLVFLSLSLGETLEISTVIWGWLLSAFLLSVIRLGFLVYSQRRRNSSNYLQMLALQYAYELETQGVIEDLEFLEEPPQNGASAEFINTLPHVEASEKFNCCICMEDVAKGDKFTILPCSHSFHSPCVDKWLKQKACCPTCKTSIR